MGAASRSGAPERAVQTRGCSLSAEGSGDLCAGGPISEIPELQKDEKLLHTVERWLRAERETRPKEDAPPAHRSAPAFANRHMAFYR